MPVAKKKPNPKRKPRQDSARSRTRILDAAEHLFSVRGFFGVSLRELTKQAGVPLALATYHFGTKEELFQAVVNRRTTAHSNHIRKKLAQVVAEAGDSPVPVRNILRAYAQALVDYSRIDEGWQNFTRLAAKASEWRHRDSYSTQLMEVYFPVMDEYIEQIHRSLPTLSREDLHWAFYFFEMVLTQFVAESGLVDRQSRGLCRSSDLERIVDKMAPFFAAGFQSFA